MKKTFIQVIFGIVTLLCLSALSIEAQAVTKSKDAKASPSQPKKEKVVLLPMDIPAENGNMMNQMQDTIVQGLQQKYQVYSGDQVLVELNKSAEKQNHSAKKTCDQTRCLQDISMVFDNAYIAMVHITKMEGGYALSISIVDIFSNESIYSKPLTCKGCDSFQLLDKLRELVGAPSAEATVGTPSPAPEETPAKVNQKDPDTLFWAEAQKGNTVEDYQVYLESYPKGKYVPFANARIKKLNEAAKAATEQQEQSAWETAQQENTEGSYGLYLKSNPAGQFAGLAKVRIDKIKREAAAAEANQRREQAAVEAKQKREEAEEEAKRKQEQATEEERQKREAGIGPAMIRIPGKNYEMGKFEVMQKEWSEIMGSNPSRFTNCGESCPVEAVSWDDIQEYLQKLNAKTGRQYRLPTEAEWEYACYGGSQTEYCGSNDIGSVAWYAGNSNKTTDPVGRKKARDYSTHPVGQKQANAYGLYDMSGNVREWMSDCWDKVMWGSNGKQLQCRRVLRGGSWSDTSQAMRASNRFTLGLPPGGEIGFRLARTLQ